MIYGNKPFFGYEVRIHDSPGHRGITTDPERRLRELQAELGPSAKIRILTPPLSYHQARNWEKIRSRPRGYHWDADVWRQESDMGMSTPL